jgi:hypothetical protein
VVAPLNHLGGYFFSGKSGQKSTRTIDVIIPIQFYPFLLDLMRNHIFEKKNRIPVITVFLFFSLFIFLGYSIYKDYGVSTDEPTDFIRGQVNYNRMMGGSNTVYQNECAKTENICYYPPLFSMLLYAYAPTGDTQSIYLHRHQLTFAVFAFSAFVFFLIGKKIFKDWKIGLLGSLFLIISPRIFSNSFYNPKDIPFLSAYIIAVFTMLLFHEKKNLLTAILHGIATAVVCSIRTPGLIIIPTTFFFYLFDLILAKEPLNLKNLRSSKYLKAILLGISFLIVTAGLMILFFPLLYTDPVGNFIKSFNIMKQYPWNDYELFLGLVIRNHTPWDYSIVWFAISSPIFYLILFFIGTDSLYSIAKTRVLAHILAMRDLYVAATCGILPIIIVIVMKSTIYNENRQMYFCYPMLLLISLYGFKIVLDKLKQRTIHWQIWAGAILVLGLAYPVYFMVRYHPNEQVYFNFLAGTKMSDIKSSFSIDSWGLSIKQGMDFIVQTDQNPIIRVWIYNGSDISSNILAKSDSDRLFFIQTSPEYIIWHVFNKTFTPNAQMTKMYSIKVGDTDLISVYKVSPKASYSP